MEILMRLVFFFIVIIASATEEVKKNLTGTEGGFITLPDPVMEEGFLSFGAKTIAMVNERKIKIYNKIYKDRVLWNNNNTGLFTITKLKRNDSGIYIIDSKDGRESTTSYKLTVYESVSTPNVTKLNESVAGSCSLLCSVEKAEETTLLWYKDEVIVNQSSSALSLPLTVHKQEFSSSYRCVAANPAENKTFTVSQSFCGGQDDTDKDTGEGTKRNNVTRIVVPIVLAVIVILVVCFMKYKYDKNKRTPRHSEEPVSREPEVEYTDIQILEDRRGQGGRLCDSSPPAERSNLTTVYDKLEVHRMQIDTFELV